MIIEFLGVPGAGKSYLAEKVAKEGKDKGLKVVNVNNMRQTSFSWKAIFKILRTILPYYAEPKKEIKELKKLSYSYSNTVPAYNKPHVRIDRYIKLSVILQVLYSHYAKSETLYIFDEGIAQEYANMIVNFNLDKKTVGEMTERIDRQFDIVYLSCPTNDVLTSIKERDRHVCFIDELSGNELVEYLENYKLACDNLAECFDVIKVDRQSNIDMNIKTIFESIKDREKQS